MTRAQLVTGLKLTGYPVAYREFKDAQEPPFVVYFFVDDDDLLADNSNYLAIGNYAVELYTNDTDPTAEAAVEAQLAALGLVWSKVETYIDAEKMNQVLYQVQLI